MTERREEREWARLLSRRHGEAAVREEFRSGLLAKLRRRVADLRSASEDADWRRLLSASPCRPSAAFRAGLGESLLAKQRETAGPGGRHEQAFRALLTAYAPVSPRDDFSDSLLSSLKDRQRRSAGDRRRFGRRTAYLSLASGLAAAGLALFISIRPLAGNVSPAVSALNVAELSDWDAESPEETGEAAGAPAAEPAFQPAPGDEFRHGDFFQGRLLPGQARIVGLEMDSGDGWRPVKTGLNLDLKPGQAFRPAAGRRSGAGFEFAGGSDIAMLDDTVLEATDQGFRLRNGVLSVEVPPGSPDRLFLHFPERDLAVRPGTYLMVASDRPDAYAEDGAPAPRVFVGEGGLAVTRGKPGDGPLFANRLYAMDSYVSPDIPGRRLCQVESDDLLKSLPDATDRLALAVAPGGRGSESFGPNLTGVFRPVPRAAPTPAGFRQRRDGAWVADNYDNRPTVKIPYLSNAYFGLADSRRDLADALSLGPEAVIDGGDGRFFEICR